MTTFLLIVILILISALGVMLFLKKRAESAATEARQNAANTRAKADQEITQARTAATDAIRFSQETFQQKTEAELSVHANKIREHYETEARKLWEENHQQLAAALAELEPLRPFAYMKVAHTEVSKNLEGAIAEATALRQEAQSLVDQTRSSAVLEERRLAHSSVQKKFAIKRTPF